ncbi:hypothetical protein ABVT39_001729, partial [Epinephelus coioides]
AALARHQLILRRVQGEPWGRHHGASFMTEPSLRTVFYRSYALSLDSKTRDL